MGPGAEKEGKRTAEAAALLTLFALIWAPFVWRMVEGMSALSLPLTHDIGFQWIPFRIFIRSCFKQGLFPLWSAEVFAGFPLAAFSHSGVFYPPGWMLLGDYARAVNFFYPLHLCIAGSGLYLLGRRLELSPLAAWFAAASYVFTGKPYYFIHFLPAACSNAWVPWFLWSLIALARRGRALYFIAAGVFLALQILGGDVESTSYALLFTAPFMFVIMRQSPSRLRLLALGGALFLAVYLALVQVFPLLELSHAFARNHGVTFAYFSQRRLPFSLIWAAVFPIRGIAPLAGAAEAPFFYLGILTLVLAGFAFIKKTAAGARSLGILVLAAMAWSFGSIPLLDHLQFLLPALDRFGTPEHAYFMGQLFLALLAGQGLQALRQAGQPGLSRAGLAALLVAALVVAIGSTRFPLLACPVVTLAFFSAGMIALMLAPRLGPGAARIMPITVFILLGLLDVYAPAIKYLPRNPPETFNYDPAIIAAADRIRASNSRYIMVSDQGLSDPVLLYHAGMALSMDEADGWITVPLKRYAELLSLADPRVARFEHGRLDRLGINADLRDGRFIDAASMPILDLVSLRWIIDRGLPLKFSTPFFLYLSPPDFHRRTVINGEAARLEKSANLDTALEAMAITAGANELYRYRLFVQAGDELVIGVDARHGAILPGASWEARVEVSEGSTTRVIFQEQGVSRPLGGESGAGPQKRVIDLSAFADQTVDLSLITTGPKDRPDLVFFWRPAAIMNERRPIKLRANLGHGVFIYENEEALPRAFVVHHAESGDGEELLNRLKGESRYALSQKVFLAREAAEPAQSGEGARGQDRAELARRRPGEEVYRVQSAGPGWLFIADQYYPGWRALVRGREEPILRADYNFRAIAVPEGVSMVQLVFVPASFRIGLYATIVSWLCAIAALAPFRGIGQQPVKERIN